ncbi:MAG: sugar phosphate nucleotidyltransferase [bacterium]|nr:sugar phosphate nucleotidyltransferase [bacterium]
MTVSKPIIAVLPLAGLGTRFLPLSKAVPKELWPLLNRPMVEYVVEEAVASGAKKIILVLSPDKKAIFDYFRPAPAVMKILKEREKTNILQELRRQDEKWQGIEMRVVWQKQPLGDGHAVLRARSLFGKKPIMVSFGDDIIISRIPVQAQLIEVFQKFGQPVLALKRVPKERTGFYGVLKVKKIGSRLYRLLKMVEKPGLGEAPSNLVWPGKCILTDEVLEYLSRAKPVFRKEIILAQTFEKMMEDGKIIYGYEVEGKWLECGNVNGWLKSNLYLANLKKM